MWCLRNNGDYLSLKHVCQGWNTRVEIEVGKYYRVWYEIVPSKNNYSKFYRFTAKSI